MKVVFKELCAAVALLCVLPVTADETIDGREIAKAMKQGLATGYVDAEIQSSCLIQITPENREYVANEAECRASLSELEKALSEAEGLAYQIDQVNRFRAKYGI